MRREKLRRSGQVIRPQTFTITRIAGQLRKIQKSGGRLRLWFPPEDGHHDTSILAMEPRRFILVEWPFPHRGKMVHKLEAAYWAEGIEHRFRSRVMGFASFKGEPVMRISYPRGIEIPEQRCSPRITPPEGKCITIEYTNVVPRRADVINISTGGLAFLVDRGSEYLPTNQVISDLLIRFPDGQTILVAGRVVRMSPYRISARKCMDICGMTFIAFAQEDREKINCYMNEMKNCSNNESDNYE
ncbi:MAG: PilZ domain-containing protein [Deltaproteobacteria bacterium]|nr:PilZ domain-containing protein [Deltaproteobacteria bacterium]MBW2305501.1 PilZ domain-containing protein [Deltaproteobacteria bacterium]